jgi:tetraacyldisaccharide 4'-kinase
MRGGKSVPICATLFFMQRIPPALAPVVFVPGLVFEALVRARNGLYSAALLPRYRLPNPVISIGNLTLGGAGKTPLVIYIAQALMKLGFAPAVLTRGYGRDSRRESHILPPEREVSSAFSAIGDEPALIRRRLPSVWMGISTDRYRAGSGISRQQAGIVFLLDDGFQHRRLHRDLDIVIIDPSQPLQSNRIFPLGTLREPLSGLRRCHVVVINGLPEAAGSVEAVIRNWQPSAKIFHCSQTIQSLIPFPAWRAGEDGGQRQRVSSAYLVAALGNPERFRQDVRRFGIEVRGSRFFPDHYRLQRRDWAACADDARAQGADAILITEKDAVKISNPPDLPLMVSVQSAGMSDPEAFEGLLQSCIEERS